MRRMSDAGIEFLKKEEGWRTEMYRDQVGLPTIGVGHLLTKDELMSGKIVVVDHGADRVMRWRDGLTDDDVHAILRADLRLAEYWVHFTAEHMPLAPHQFDALVSFAFNVGVVAYQRSTLVKKILARAYDEVPAQLRRWVYGGGKKLPVLVNRREREIALWHGPPPEVAA